MTKHVVVMWCCSS